MQRRAGFRAAELRGRRSRYGTRASVGQVPGTIHALSAVRFLAYTARASHIRHRLGQITNFNWIGRSLTSVHTIATGSRWYDVMFTAVDSTSLTTGRSHTMSHVSNPTKTWFQTET